MNPPRMPFRILRHHTLTPCAINYKTKEARDRGAARYAERDGRPVLLEEWSAEDWDPYNAGWWMVGVVEPDRTAAKS